MSTNDRPQVSRELVDRLSQGIPIRRKDAYGVSAKSAYGSRRPKKSSDRSYSSSMLGRQWSSQQRATPVKKGDDSDSSEPSQASGSSGGLQKIETNTNRPSAGFKEPPGRRYDPYR